MKREQLTNLLYEALETEQGGIKVYEAAVSAATSTRGPADNFGTGLAGMKARIEQLGGHLTAGRGGESWIVQAVVPLRAPTTRGTRQPVNV